MSSSGMKGVGSSSKEAMTFGPCDSPSSDEHDVGSCDAPLRLHSSSSMIGTSSSEPTTSQDTEESSCHKHVSSNFRAPLHKSPPRRPSLLQHEAAKASLKDVLLLQDDEDHSLKMNCNDDEFVAQQRAILEQIRAESCKLSRPPYSVSHVEEKNQQQPNLSARPRLKQDDEASFQHDDDDDDDGFLRYMNDPEAIEEQRKIMDAILCARETMTTRTSTLEDSQATAATPCPPYASLTRACTDCVSLDAVGSSTSTMTRQELNKMESCIDEVASLCYKKKQAHPTRPGPLHPSTCADGRLRQDDALSRQDDALSRQKSLSSSTLYAKEDDALIELSQGRTLRVRGTNHTWKSIANGQATLVQCPMCRTILQVGSNAKLLYCTNCHVVSLIQKDSTQLQVAVANDDEKIARVLQKQEVNVAVCKQMAKQAPP